MSWDQATQDRFWAKVRRCGTPADCWLWAGASDKTGYGRVKVGASIPLVHRFAWESMRGPIPDGLHIDHLCRVRLCVNPDHMEPVSQRENTLRGDSPVAIAHRENRCKRGHDLSAAYVRSNGSRTCRACQRQRRAEARAVPMRAAS